MNLKHVNEVVKTFKRNTKGIENAIITETTSSKQANLNGRIQSVIAKGRGFFNFKKFKINVMFYFGNLDLKPLKFHQSHQISCLPIFKGVCPVLGFRDVIFKLMGKGNFNRNY
jgi:hypothetical protein